MLTEHEIQSVLIANLNALMRKEGFRNRRSLDELRD